MGSEESVIPTMVVVCSPEFRAFRKKVPHWVNEASVGLTLQLKENGVDGQLYLTARTYTITSRDLADSLVQQKPKSSSNEAGDWLRSNLSQTEALAFDNSSLKPVLKPCPFCGGSPHESTEECGGFDSIESGCIKCSSCGAKGPTLSTSRWDIRNAWNRRHRGT